jgi:acetate---CoA ligase (ADP-forming)
MPVDTSPEYIAAILATLDPPAVSIVGYSPESSGSQHLIDCLERSAVPRPVHRVNARRAAAGEEGYVASVNDIDGPLGLVFVLLAGDAAVAAVEAIGVRPSAVVVFGGGGADEGRLDVEQRLADWAVSRFPGVRVPVFGPQSMGVFSPLTGFFGTNSSIPEEWIGGGLGFVSQSGGFLGSLARCAFSRGLGLAASVAVGNGRVTSVFDAALALMDYDEVSVVSAYLEDVSDLRAMAVLGEASMACRKPVLLAVGGVSDAGSLAARSHTGALATEERVLSGVARQFGIVVVRSPEEIVWGAEALLDNDLRTPPATGAAVLGFTGGGVIVVADELSRQGLQLPDPDPLTIARVNEALGSSRHIYNPFDGGPGARSPEGIETVIGAFTSDPNIGVLAYVAGAGLPTPTTNHQFQLETLARHVVASHRVGVVASLVPDTASGPYRMPGVTVGRGSHEMAVKARVLADWSRSVLEHPSAGVEAAGVGAAGVGAAHV